MALGKETPNFSFLHLSFFPSFPPPSPPPSSPTCQVPAGQWQPNPALLKPTSQRKKPTTDRCMMPGSEAGEAAEKWGEMRGVREGLSKEGLVSPNLKEVGEEA